MEEGDLPGTSESPASFPQECLVGTKREVCETVEPSPLTLALSPNPRNVLGERENIVGTMTQSIAPLGLYVEEAASCRFTNVQSRHSRETRIQRCRVRSFLGTPFGD